MKMKEALKKFNFLKQLNLTDTVLLGAANQLAKIIEGDSEIHMTPLAKAADPISVLVGWDEIYDANKHKMNSTLIDLEFGNRSKFGARSRSLPWSERMASLKSSFNSQDEKHIPKYKSLFGEANLDPATLEEALAKMKLTSNAGFPFLIKKGKILNVGSNKPDPYLFLDNFDMYLERYDPCALFTRTQERWKTRNVWGYPFADTLYEMKYYIPILEYQKTKYYRAALISPNEVSKRITEIIKLAINSNRIIYSVDFANFDASVKFQYIIAAFEYFASCFMPMFQPLLKDVAERLYTIAIVTPSAVFRGKHGVPSGATFTNEVDSIVQLIIALTNDFIKETECQIQGDDGIYIMLPENIPQFDKSFVYAGLKIEKQKSIIAKNFAIYCQNLYHMDYIGEDGIIGGVYPTYRAINRILFMERFVDFKKLGIAGQDYFGIRCLSILENCKHHPLFKELVRYILIQEKFSLQISDDGLLKYCEGMNLNIDTADNLKHQYGSDIMGIRNFESYKMAQLIINEPGFRATEDV